MNFDLEHFTFLLVLVFFSLCNLLKRKIRPHKNTKKVYLSLSLLYGSSP
jgi:hypothetical protein